MAKIGRYSRAYLVSDLKKFHGWKPSLENLRPADSDEPKAGSPRRQLADDDVLYLQEDLVVTDGHFRDQHVVFESADEAWRSFCAAELGFAVPPEVVAIGQ